MKPDIGRGDGEYNSLTDTSQTGVNEPMPLWERKLFTVEVTNLWPAPVSCNMNIPIWIDLMEAAGLERDIPYMAEGFKSGFCLGIPQHELTGLKWYTRWLQ